MSISRRMDKKAVVHIHSGAIKKNTFESVLMRWMKLEPIIQSKVSQKEKHQYSILMHIYGTLKDGNNNPEYETAKEYFEPSGAFGNAVSGAPRQPLKDRRGWGEGPFWDWLGRSV